jgi:ABC-type transport system involved in multi-copper enzyme maturation permease subunit
MTALASSIPLPRSNSFPRPRLVGAEILKLRKRRGLVATVGLLTVGASLAISIILVSLHAADSVKHGPAGGVSNLGHTLWVLSTLGAVAAILVGGTAGAGDLGSGVFRELVVTGRSRTALFAARIPGGLAVLLSFIGVAYAITVVSSVVFAGSLAAPSASTLIGGGLWLMLSTGFWFAVALGLSSLLGSRTTPIAVLLPFQLALSPLLVSFSLLGPGRDALPIAGLNRLLPDAVSETTSNAIGGPSLSVATAVFVLGLWVVVSLGVGAWRTKTRDA